MKFVWPIAFALACSAIFAVPDAANFQRPEFARIMLIHLPCAFSSVVMLIASAYMSIKWLRTRQLEWDYRAEALSELCLMFIALTLGTGILFSKVQWGDWWHGDPRQTSFLLVFLMFGAYFLLRMAHSDPARRASAGAGYQLAMVLPILFLTFVFPRLKQVAEVSLHPKTTVPRWEMSSENGIVLIAVFATLLGTSFMLYRQRVQSSKLAADVEDLDAELAFRRASSTHGVVRPVVVSTQDEA